VFRRGLPDRGEVGQGAVGGLHRRDRDQRGGGADGVGELVRQGVQRGRSVKRRLKVGVCGEHGGDPASIAFFLDAGLDYVSCSPYRVPIARLAAAHAVIGISGDTR